VNVSKKRKRRKSPFCSLTLYFFSQSKSQIFRAPDGFYFSFDSFDRLNALANEDLAGGPYTDNAAKGTTGREEAFKRGTKATSLKRLLLNRCQEAFETGDIYAEVRDSEKQ
jgi:hypothetical protein